MHAFEKFRDEPCPGFGRQRESYFRKIIVDPAVVGRRNFERNFQNRGLRFRDLGHPDQISRLRPKSETDVGVYPLRRLRMLEKVTLSKRLQPGRRVQAVEKILILRIALEGPESALNGFGLKHHRT